LDFAERRAFWWYLLGTDGTGKCRIIRLCDRMSVSVGILPNQFEKI
jgi:hypothetical protein